MYPGKYDGDEVKRWAGDSQWRRLRADYARRKQYGHSGWGNIGFWAMILYRIQRAIRLKKSQRIWLPIRAFFFLINKIFVGCTSINLEPGADIGPGLMIVHGGPIRLHHEAVIGADCCLFHVVTIGTAVGARKEHEGGAIIGDHVLIGCHSTILGPVRIGDCATIAANSLVIRDVPPFATAIGVPAQNIPGTKRGKASDTAALKSSGPGENPSIVTTESLVNRSSETAYDLLIRHATAYPDSTALTFVEGPGRYRHVTWSELSTHAHVARSWLLSSTSPSEPIVIYSRRTIECVALILAAIGSGRPFSCLNPKWKWPQILQVIGTISCRTIFTDQSGVAALEQCLKEGSNHLSLVIIESVFSSQPIANKYSADDARTPIGAYLFTSGSTGEPKCVCIDRDDLSQRARQEVAWYELTGKDILLNLLPFSFDVGLNQILAAIFARCETILLDSWMPADILTTVADRNVTGIPCVPSIWQEFIIQKLSFVTNDTHRHLRFITVSGGDLPLRFQRLLPDVVPGVGIFKTYGQTEDFRSTSLRPDEYDRHHKSVGKPFPGVTVRIVRPDGTLAVRNEVGELVHSGLGVMAGYLGDEEQTNRKRRSIPDEPETVGIFTGDNAFIDSNGYIHLVGRSDKLVKIQGNRFYPDEVRNQLCELPIVVDAIVLAEKAANGDTVLIAFIVTNEVIDEASMVRELRNRLPGYMVPQYIKFAANLPRTASGKPDGEALRPQAREIVSKRNVKTVSTDGDFERVEEWVVQFVHERIDVKYDPKRDRLIDVVDSMAYFELIQGLEREFSFKINISGLSLDALESLEAFSDFLRTNRY